MLGKTGAKHVYRFQGGFTIEFDGDEGDLGDFLSEGEFAQELCGYEWTWTEETVQPLVRFW